MTCTCRSVDTHCSTTILIGCTLPMAPAGIVVVLREPVAVTPSMFCWPRLSVTTSVFGIGGAGGAGGGGGGAPGDLGAGGGGGGASLLRSAARRSASIFATASPAVPGPPDRIIGVRTRT